MISYWAPQAAGLAAISLLHPTGIRCKGIKVSEARLVEVSRTVVTGQGTHPVHHIGLLPFLGAGAKEGKDVAAGAG